MLPGMSNGTAASSFEDCGLPNVEGNQPEGYVQAYVKGLMQRSTKLSSVLGQLEAIPVGQRSDNVKTCLAYDDIQQASCVSMVGCVRNHCCVFVAQADSEDDCMRADL